jgi:SAM-dependent methyltransferase
VALSAEFTDPRLVAVYDTLHGYEPGTQPDFYLALASETGATRVVEIGCGTGLIAVRLARAGFDVTGLDPSERMLAAARRRPGAQRVRWMLGEVSGLTGDRVDLAFMAGHVAQLLLTDEAWQEALTTIHGALRPGGVLAFESRNPAARAWERWTPAQTRRTVTDPAVGAIETWTADVEVSGDVVTVAQHCRFPVSEEVLTARTSLRFRSPADIRATLEAGGFAVERLYGAWDRRPFSGGDEEIVVVARRLS